MVYLKKLFEETPMNEKDAKDGLHSKQINEFVRR